MKKHSGHMHSFDQIQAFVAGALPEAQARELEAHIVSCAECRAIADKLRSLDAIVAQAEEISVPDKYFDTFGSRVASRIAAKKMAPVRGRFHFPLWGVIPLATAAGLVLVIALRMEPPAPHLTIQLPPATRTGPVAPVEQISPAPAVTTMPASQRGEQKAEIPMSGESTLAAKGSSPATVPGEQDLAARIEEAAPSAAPAARSDEQKAESSFSDKPLPTANASALVETRQAKKTAEPFPAPPVAPAAPGTPVTTVVPSGAIVVLRWDKERVPGRVGSAKDLQSQSPVGAPAVPVRVIVIHLPDGGSYCPAPDIAPAIEITLPPAVSVN